MPSAKVTVLFVSGVDGGSSAVITGVEAVVTRSSSIVVPPAATVADSGAVGGVNAAV